MLNSQRFVDKAPPQIYATLLAEGTYQSAAVYPLEARSLVLLQKVAPP